MQHNSFIFFHLYSLSFQSAMESLAYIFKSRRNIMSVNEKKSTVGFMLQSYTSNTTSSNYVCEHSFSKQTKTQLILLKS